jgi:polyketide synthase PksN
MINYGGSIAIVGISLRFPGAATTAEFWENLRDGVESIRFMSAADCELFAIPIDRRSNRRFVPAEGIPEAGALFNPADFRMTHESARLVDPQQKPLLQCTSEVLGEFNPNKHAVGGVFVGYSMFGHTLTSWPLTVVRHAI